MTNIPSVLQRIITTKWQELDTAKAQQSLPEIKEQALAQHASGDYLSRGFAQALRHAWQLNHVGIIAEIKQASPSKGIISPNFDPISTSRGKLIIGVDRCAVF